MSFATANHIRAVSKYVDRKYGKGVFSQHFIYRAYQRLPSVEARLSVLAELRDLVRSGMHQYLFTKGSTTCNILLQDAYEVACELKQGKLVVKTIMVPGKNRAERLRRDTTGIKANIRQ